MVKYPLKQLLAAREFRQEQAERATHAAMQEAENARQTAATAKETWQRYQVWRPGEEIRLFNLLRGQIVTQTELHNHQQQIQDLRQKERDLEQTWHEAEKAVLTADQKVSAARIRQNAAIRDANKIEQHRQRWQLAENRRIEENEALELEEFPYRPGEDEQTADNEQID